MANYSITWQTHTGPDYKFYHTTNSIVVPCQKKEEKPWRYPFADIFIYKHQKEYNVITYRNRFKDLSINGVKLRNTGFSPLFKWPNGTRLTKFGYYEMRVSVENRGYLEKLIGLNWHDHGRINWWDHVNDRERTPTAFEIPPNLYAPAMPFTLKAV